MSSELPHRSVLPQRTWTADEYHRMVEVEIHRQPAVQGYSVVLMAGPGEAVAAEAFPDVIIPVGEILGR